MDYDKLLTDLADLAPARVIDSNGDWIAVPTAPSEAICVHPNADGSPWTYLVTYTTWDRTHASDDKDVALTNDADVAVAAVRVVHAKVMKAYGELERAMAEPEIAIPDGASHVGTVTLAPGGLRVNLAR